MDNDCLPPLLPALTHPPHNHNLERDLPTLPGIRDAAPLRKVRVQPGGSFVVYLPGTEDSADPAPLSTTTTVCQENGRDSKRRVKMRIERRPQGPHDPASLQSALRDVPPGLPVQRQRPGWARRMIMGIKRGFEGAFSMGGH